MGQYCRKSLAKNGGVVGVGGGGWVGEGRVKKI